MKKIALLSKMHCSPARKCSPSHVRRLTRAICCATMNLQNQCGFSRGSVSVFRHAPRRCVAFLHGDTAGLKREVNRHGQPHQRVGAHGIGAALYVQRQRDRKTPPRGDAPLRPLQPYRPPAHEGQAARAGAADSLCQGEKLQGVCALLLRIRREHPRGAQLLHQLQLRLFGRRTHHTGRQCAHRAERDAGHAEPPVHRGGTRLHGLPQRRPRAGIRRTHHPRGPLLALLRRDGLRRRDRRGGQHRRRRGGGDARHPAGLPCRRRPRQGRAAARRARSPARVGDVCEKRAAAHAAINAGEVLHGEAPPLFAAIWRKYDIMSNYIT